MYPDPETFNPDRWLLPHYPTFCEPLTTYPNLNGYSQFGFGRRTCQGLPIVEQDLFLTMGGMAWAFDIRKKRDTDGNEIPVHWDNYTPLLIAKPVRFQFDAVVHDVGRMQAIADMFVDNVNDGDSAVDVADNIEQHKVAADSGSDHDFFVNVRDTPPHSPSPCQPSRGRKPEPEMEQSQPVEKHKHSGPWQHNTLLRTQGPIVVR